ncbi:unnamed protein product [Amoebophrya sp. A25]|nr:unnamed protein product [Amoebophrya sp. A25]|eukprot:GSA25T00008474001.1
MQKDIKEAVKEVILFLDIDGVLHPLGGNHLPVGTPVEALLHREELGNGFLVEELQENSKDKKFDSYTALSGEFCEKNLQCLQRLVVEAGQKSRNKEEVEVHIVLISTWREKPWSLECAKRELAKYGLEIQDATPILAGADVRQRPAEIALWLENKAYSKSRSRSFSYVVLDDADLVSYMPEHVDVAVPSQPSIEKERFLRVDMAFGLTDADVDKALRILEKPVAGSVF